MPPLIYGAAVAGKFIAGRIAQAAVSRGLMAAGRAMVSGEGKAAIKLALMNELGLQGGKGKTMENLINAVDYIFSKKSAWEKWLKGNGGESRTSSRIGRGNNFARKSPVGGKGLTKKPNPHSNGKVRSQRPNRN